MAALCQNEVETQQNHHEAELPDSENEDKSDMVNDDVIYDTPPMKLVQLICVFCYLGKALLESPMLQLIPY